jgi:hypothetical protein
MKVSTLWLLLVLVLALHGHPMTGALFAFPWLGHRRWEKGLKQAHALPHMTYKAKITFSHLSVQGVENLPTTDQLQQDLANGWAADPDSANEPVPTIVVVTE